MSGVDLALAEGASFDDAAPEVLRALCESLGWDVGIAWRFEESDRALRFLASWHHPSGPMTELEKLSQRSSFSPGVGLPGRIMSAAEPMWITDVQKDRGFPRSPAAMEDGLHAGFGFPLIHGWSVVGVMEFFSKKARERDGELLSAVAPIGRRLGELLAGETAT